MINLSERSYKKEILDNDDIPFADIMQNMKELNTVNTLLGGHAITISGIKKIISKHKTKQSITICEIGCGGGDNLNAIEKWCVKNNLTVNFNGIDIKLECIDFARKQYPSLPCNWIVSDYKNISFEGDKPDIIFSSLFCHHFNDKELIFMLQWMQQNATLGFFINDLHRHWLAYYSIQIITGIFSHSYLVKNDAPLSVARGFKKEEWIKILTSAGIQNNSVNWKWAFRYLIVYTHD
jgi:2-polyprenyl-3-methyl-5-hydroxy-6-metoxy-1,4-benzoquinol methylase